MVFGKLNRIQTWRTEGLKHHLPSLIVLDVTANAFDWSPDDHVLQLERLHEIRGVTWSDACADCSLVRNYSTGKIKKYISTQISKDVLANCPLVMELECQVVRISSLGKGMTNFTRHGYLPRCRTSTKCYRSDVIYTLSNHCWDTINDIQISLYFTGTLAVVFNLLVVVVTAKSKSLRQNVPMLLVASMSLGDLMNGLYVISLAAVRRSLSMTAFVRHVSHICPYIGFLWALGQSASALTSLVVTTERYFAIVFSLRPHLRMRTKGALVCLVVCSVLAVLMGALPHIGVGSYNLSIVCSPVTSNLQSSLFSALFAALTIISYALAVPMYVHIYLVVRKSSQNMGVKRESVLAFRIACLVFSNLFFFLVPVVISMLIVFAHLSLGLSKSSRYVFIHNFPYICLSVNSCLNPALYAFRNEKFKNELRRMVRKVSVPRQAVPEPLKEERRNAEERKQQKETQESEHKEQENMKRRHKKTQGTPRQATHNEATVEDTTQPESQLSCHRGKTEETSRVSVEHARSVKTEATNGQGEVHEERIIKFATKEKGHSTGATQGEETSESQDTKL